MSRRIVLLDAPSNLGLEPPSPGRQPGVRKLPDALRKQDLLPRISAADGGRVIPPPYDPAIDPESHVRNAQQIASYAHAVADRLAPMLDHGDFPLLLGGDCSILLGPLLSLRRRGQYGLCFIDGHLDLLTPETSQTKGAAGMDLAFAIGHGPKMLADLGGLGPLVQDRDVAAIGYRGELAGYGELANGPDRPNLQWNPLEEVLKLGPKHVADSVVSHFMQRGLQGFWVHLDVDVLDDQVMPAVDSRQPGGLSYTELGEMLSGLLGSPGAVGMEITILDPELDPEGQIIKAFVAFLEEMFEQQSDFSGGPA